MKNNPWILASRPKTLFASLAPVLLGLSIAYSYQKNLNYLVAFLTLLSALLMQIASNIANDYLDSERGIDGKERLGPIRATASGLISKDKMKKALIILLALSFSLGFYLMWVGGSYIILIGLLSLYFSYGYSGGPYPLSHHGLGEFAAFIFYGVLAVTGTTFLQTHSLTPLTLYLSLGPGFISATILAINNLRDLKSDSLSKKRTLAVIFGEKIQRKVCLYLILLSSLLLLFLAFYKHLFLLFPVSLLPLLFIKTWKQIAFSPIDQNLNKALAKTALYLLLYCIFTSLVLLLK